MAPALYLLSLVPLVPCGPGDTTAAADTLHASAMLNRHCHTQIQGGCAPAGGRTCCASRGLFSREGAVQVLRLFGHT